MLDLFTFEARGRGPVRVPATLADPMNQKAGLIHLVRFVKNKINRYYWF